MKQLHIRIPASEIDRFVAITAIGLCAALESRAITVSDAETVLFSPYSAELVRSAGGSSLASEMIYLGAELEDAVDQENLLQMIAIIQRAAHRLLRRCATMNRDSKWIQLPG